MSERIDESGLFAYSAAMLAVLFKFEMQLASFGVFGLIIIGLVVLKHNSHVASTEPLMSLRPDQSKSAWGGL